MVVGITTFNRRALVEKCARSLSEAEGIHQAEIGVWDDCSTEYGIDFLQRCFPGAVIFRSPSNLGADRNIYRMYQDFVYRMDADCLVNVDSDLIVNPDFLQCAAGLIDHTDGILSLYHSFKHPGGASYSVAGTVLVEKRSLGSAGVVFTRELLAEIIDKVPPSRQYDWDWSRYLVASGRRLLVCRESRVQHLGETGYNTSGFLEMDFGLGFWPQTEFNRRCLVEITERLFQQCMMLRQEQERRYHLIEKDSWVGRLFSVGMRCKRFFFPL